MITEVALLENEDFDPNALLSCEGSYQYGDRVFGCWADEGHGNVDLTSAILQSCDIYFYKTIQYYELDRLAQYFRLFGFGKITGIDIGKEYKGTIPNTAYMNKRYGRFGWSNGSLLNFCIGQGEILVTPIQVFNYTNLLATKGNANSPHLVSSMKKEPKSELSLAPQIWDRIIFDMGQVISHAKGTGKNADPAIEGVEIYGKTGTAENPHGEDHAWFIGWVQYEGRKFSIVVLLENSGSGGAVAAPVAKIVFDKIISFYNNSKQISMK